MLWRRRILIVGLVLIITAIGAVYIGNITPQYTATATVMLESRSARVIKAQSSVETKRLSGLVMRGEIEVLRSRSLASRVVEDMALQENHNFNPKLRPPAPFFNTLNPIALAKKVYHRVVPPVEPEITDPELERREIHRQAVDSLISRLTIKQPLRTPVLKISVTTDDPALSANVANHVAKAYVLSQLEAKFEATRQATEWLSTRLDGLRQKVLDSENAVAAFRAEHKLMSGRGAKLTEEKLSELNTQYILAKTARAEAQARYNHVRSLKNNKGKLDTAAQALESKLLERLLAQEADLQRKFAELDERYGERHPKIINVRSELADIRSKIEREVSKIGAVLRNQLEVARSRENALRGALDEATGEAASEGSVNVTLRQLERESEANRLLYENFLARFKETSQQQDIQQADARILSEAVTPGAPSKPRKTLLLTMTFLGSLGFALFVAMLLEQIDVGLRSAEQIETLTGLPVLAMISAVKPKDGAALHRYVLDEPVSAATEAVRNLYTSLRTGNGDHPPRTVCLTSTLSNEGKSTLSIWLARIAAMHGRKVILLDCDLRRAQMHTTLGINNDNSLAELLVGDRTFEECVQVDDASDAHFLPGKVLHANALNLLTSDAFSELIEQLKKDYDLVLLDAPPVLAVSDARVLSGLADTCLYLMRWNHTDRKALRSGLNQLRGADANLLGIAVTQVDTRKHQRYGYGDMGHYYGRYKGYYHDQA